MPLVDVHCHLTHDYYKEKFEEFLTRAKKNHIEIIICSGINPRSNREVIKLTKKYPMIKASLGLYPIDLLGLNENDIGFGRETEKFDIDKELKFIETNKDQVISIGEIGMDFHWADKEETFEKQREIFRKIIQFAIKINKPIVIHSRKAEKECIDLMEEEVQGKVDALLTMVCVRKTDPDAYDFVLKELTRMAILGTLPPGSRLRNST